MSPAWIERRGFIALLDLLGFKEMMKAEAFRTDLDYYLSTLDSARSIETAAIRGERAVKFVCFADTMALYTETSDVAAFSAIVRAVALLQLDMLCNELPIRGAITEGPLYLVQEQDRIVLAGPTAIRAHEMETEQEWCGVRVDPAILEEDRTIRDAVCGFHQPPYTREDRQRFDENRDIALLVHHCSGIPRKRNDPEAGPVVIPGGASYLLTEVVANLTSALAAYEGLLSRCEAAPPSSELERVKEKYRRSIAWLRSVRDAGAAFDAATRTSDPTGKA